MKNEYWINIQYVDNRLVIFLNSEAVFDCRIVDSSNQKDSYVNITHHLIRHNNRTTELIFEVFNDNYDNTAGGFNPLHFNYRVFTRLVDDTGKVVTEMNMITPYNEKHISNPNIRAINKYYQIQRRDGEFKVVSNSLTQNFF